MKRKWETPQLISVYKAQPEEAVLFGCKNSQPRGPASSYMGCYYDMQYQACNQIVYS